MPSTVIEAFGRVNANLDTYTLHVENNNAISFYHKLEYVQYCYGDPIQKGSGLEDWINNYRKKNDWHLRLGNLLYYISLSDL